MHFLDLGKQHTFEAFSHLIVPVIELTIISGRHYQLFTEIGVHLT